MRIKIRLLITAILPFLMGVILSGLNYIEIRNSAEISRYRDNIDQLTHAVFELALMENDYQQVGKRERVITQWQQRHHSLGLLLQQTPPALTAEETDALARLRQTHGSVGFLFDQIAQIHAQENSSAPLGQESRDWLFLLSSQQRTKMHEMLAYTDRILNSIALRKAEQKRFFQFISYAVIGGMMLVSLLLTLIINRHIIQSLLRLRQGTAIIGSGEMSHRIDLPSRDEFSQLADAFNQMSQQLQESYRQLEVRIAELTAANQELATFSHAASHNFRTPMRALNGLSASLLAEYGDQLDATGQHYIREIQAGCREMEQIIHAFLQLTRATMAGIEYQPVDLSRLAMAILQRHHAREPAREVTWEVAPALLTIGDITQLRTVLENLLDNAWKFSGHSPDAHIRFGAAIQEGATVYHVSDNGAGFDMAFADKLFQPFQRLHPMTEFPGISLGLAIAQRIIARHGGRIWAQAQPGQGATFFFTLADRSLG